MVSWRVRSSPGQSSGLDFPIPRGSTTRRSCRSSTGPSASVRDGIAGSAGIGPPGLASTVPAAGREASFLGSQAKATVIRSEAGAPQSSGTRISPSQRVFAAAHGCRNPPEPFPIAPRRLPGRGPCGAAEGVSWPRAAAFGAVRSETRSMPQVPAVTSAVAARRLMDRWFPFMFSRLVHDRAPSLAARNGFPPGSGAPAALPSGSTVLEGGGPGREPGGAWEGAVVLVERCPGGRPRGREVEVPGGRGAGRPGAGG